MTMTVETFLTVLMMVEIFLTVGTTMQIFLALAAAIITLNEKSCRRMQRAGGTGEDQLYSVLDGRGAASQRACLGGGGEEQHHCVPGGGERSSFTTCLGEVSSFTSCLGEVSSFTACLGEVSSFTACLGEVSSFTACFGMKLDGEHIVAVFWRRGHTSQHGAVGITASGLDIIWRVVEHITVFMVQGDITLKFDGWERHHRHYGL